MRVRQRRSNIAVVAIELQHRQPVRGSRLALLLGRLHLLHHRRQILPVGVRLANCRLHIQLVKRCVRGLVCQVEALRQRQPDGARQRQFVLLQRIPRHNQLLLQRLVIHLRPQLVQQRRGARLVVRGCLVQRDLRRRHLRFHAAYLCLVGNHQQVRISHRQHHHVARVVCRELRGAKVVPRRKVVSQRLHVHQRPAQRSPHIRVAEWPDNLRKSRKPQSLRGQIHLLHRFLAASIHRRQQRLQLAQPLPACGRRLRPAQNHAQISSQSALHRIVQREIDGLRRHIARGHAALKTGCRRRSLIGRLRCLRHRSARAQNREPQRWDACPQTDRAFSCRFEQNHRFPTHCEAPALENGCP